MLIISVMRVHICCLKVLPKMLQVLLVNIFVIDKKVNDFFENGVDFFKNGVDFLQNLAAIFKVHDR